MGENCPRSKAKQTPDSLAWAFITSWDCQALIRCLVITHTLVHNQISSENEKFRDNTLKQSKLTNLPSASPATLPSLTLQQSQILHLSLGTSLLSKASASPCSICLWYTSRVSSWLAPLPPAVLCSKVTVSGWPFPTTYLKLQSLSTPSLHYPVLIHLKNVK